jgi:hypothetical protein
MRTLKKPFTLLLILSHLNAFVLGGVSNVHAANQVVDTTKSLTTSIKAIRIGNHHGCILAKHF